MTRPVSILFLALMLINPGQEVWAQAYREQVKFPPHELYRSMLGFAERGENDKIVKTLDILSPVLAHIKDKYRVSPADSIQKAIAQGDPKEILLSVQRLMVWDIKDLLDAAGLALEDSPTLAYEFGNQARLNYFTMSPYVQKKDFSADQMIKKWFTDTLRALSSQSPFSDEEKNIDHASIKRFWSNIEASLSKIFL